MVRLGCIPLSESLPAWGVWIEITSRNGGVQTLHSHSPHGECGLKLWRELNPDEAQKVTPRMGSVD